MSAPAPTLAWDEPASGPAAATTSGLPGGYRRTALTGYAYTAAALVVAVVATPVLARALGPTSFGIWSLVGSSVSYLEVLELGFGAATVSYVAERAAARDREGVRRVVATSFWVLAAPGGVGLVLSLLAAWAAPSVLDLAPGDVAPTRALIVLLAVDLAVSIPSDSFGGALAGLRRLDLVNSSLVVGLLLTAAGWFVVLALGGGIVALGVVTAVIGLGGQGARFLLARRLVPGLSVRPRLVQRSTASAMSRLSGWFALSDVNRVVVQRLDILLVGAVVGVAPAGIYAVGQKLALLIAKCAEPATAVLFPHSAELLARGDREGLRSALLVGSRLTLAVAVPLAAGLAWFARPLLELWVGQGYGDATRVVVLLALAAVAGSLATCVQLVLKGMRRARAAAGGATADALVNLTLSVLLGRLLGAWGVALATLVAATVAAAVLVPAACRAVGVRPLLLFGSLLRAHLPPLAVAAAAALASRALLPHPGLLVLPLAGGVVTLHLLLLARTALDTAERQALAGRLGRLVPRRRTGVR